MSNFRLKVIRSNEDLILNKDPKVCIKGRTAQYLLNHQINGVRFLYENFKKKKSSILNDENGSGKCFQCVAFLDAILNPSTGRKILILCQLKQNLEHWKYHIDNLLENASVTIADYQNDGGHSGSSVPITIASIEHVLSGLSTFTTNQFDCLILQDQHLQTSATTFKRLTEIKANTKIVICSKDLTDELKYFYEVLKFCDQTGPLRSSKQPNDTYSLGEFRLKFGCNDSKTISKRNQVFRQRNLLHACNSFYIRRLCNQLGSQFPPIDSEHFHRNFNEWKSNIYDCDTQPVESNAILEDDSSPMELLPNPNDRSNISAVSDEVSLLNTACTDFSDFDTQMSPLIYSDSDDSESGKRTANVVRTAQIVSSQNFTPEIACNQEHAARTRNSTKETSSIPPNSHTTPTKRKSPDKNEKMSPATKRLNYKKLPIKISGNGGRLDTKLQTYLFRTRKQKLCNLSNSSDSSSQKPSKMTHNVYSRSVSSTSDVQIVEQSHNSPILISSSSIVESQVPDEIPKPKSDNPKATSMCPSPDLFESFTSIKSEPASQKSDKNQSKYDDKPQDDTELNTFRDVFGRPDECDDIDLLSNKNVDIFEITKNSVFGNVLCSADDRITPLKSNPNVSKTTTRPSPNTSCLSGLRVVIPGMEAADTPSDRLSQRKPSIDNNDDDDILVDLTSSESQLIIEISSEDSNRNIEKTPEHRQELTPSTRSCLKPDLSTEQRKRTPRLRTGWLSTTRTSPLSGTPQSRRRLEKWRKRMSDLRPDENVKITKPRNLINEFKSSKTKPTSIERKRLNVGASTSTQRSPNIFSDNDE